MSETSAQDRSLEEEEEHGAFLHGVPGHLAALGCGLTAIGLSSVTFIPELKVMAMIDLPVALVCLFAATFLALGSRQKMGMSLTGVVLAALGSIIAAVHLLVDHQHPWFA